MKKVLIYVRVSTNNQAEEGYSIDMQIEKLKAYCISRNWIIDGIYSDPGYSGSNTNRPGLNALIQKVNSKKSDFVLVYKLDRLSRSQKDTLYLIEDVFLPNGVNFVSLQESFDTATPIGRAVLGLLSVFAQLERENIKQRTMMGRSGRAKDGFWHGGGTDPIGYDYIDGELVINKEEADQVRMVYEMYAAGHTLSFIRDRMEGYTTKHGDWQHIGTITNVLDNELYNGTVHFQDIRSPDSHNAIIDGDLFSKVRNMRERNKKLKYGDKESCHLLTGMLYCRECGGRYFAKKNPNGSYKYLCHSRAKVNKKMVKDPGCKNHIWDKAELEQKINRIILEVAQNPDSIKKTAVEVSGGNAIHSHDKEDKEISKINKEIDRYMTLYGNDKIPVEVISDKIDALYNKRKLLLLSSECEEKTECYVKSFSEESARLVFKDVAYSWNGESLSYKRQILKNLIDGIDIDGVNVYIRWSFH